MIVSKDENIKTSAVYLGSLILKQFKKKDKLSIFEITENFQKYDIINYREIIPALMFLYACGIIDFKEPFVYKL
jgi:hypothetical protein